MNEDRIYAVIKRHLSGESDPQDREALKAWLTKHEHNRLIYRAIQEYWSSEETSSDAQDKILKKVFDRMDRHSVEAAPFKTVPQARKTLIPAYLYRAAAVLLICAVVSWVAYYRLSPTPEQPPVNEIVEKIIPIGQKSTIRLSDGTIVKLNADSRLKYSKRFDGPSRKVYLEGEAFFEVEEDTLRPFLVHSGDVITSVLGTSFNIKAHAEEQTVKVALVSGKVKLHHTVLDSLQFSYTLAPNEMLTYRKDLARSEKGYFNKEDVLAWKEQTLFFENADLAEMAVVLKRWYGKQFVINHGEAITRKFSGKFTNNKSLEYVLDVLSLDANFTYRITDNAVIIEGKP